MQEQNKLEASKLRLAKALKKLEQVLDDHLFKSSAEEDQVSIDNLEKDFHNLKLINIEAIKELNASIETIETILNSKNANSKHNDSQ